MAFYSGFSAGISGLGSASLFVGAAGSGQGTQLCFIPGSLSTTSVFTSGNKPMSLVWQWGNSSNGSVRACALVVLTWMSQLIKLQPLMAAEQERSPHLSFNRLHNWWLSREGNGVWIYQISFVCLKNRKVQCMYFILIYINTKPSHFLASGAGKWSMPQLDWFLTLGFLTL